MRVRPADLGRLAPGVALTLFIAAAATLLAGAIPLAGAPVIAIALGIALHGRCGPAAAIAPGIGFSARLLLRAAIVISGLGIPFGAVVATGFATLPLTLVTVGLALALTPLVARALGVERPVAVLIGVGTAICGASAIAAVSVVLESGAAEIALAVSTVFFYNVIAVLVFPPLGHVMHLGQIAFGTWAGTAINDTSSVVAAGYVYGSDAATQATIVKLTRAMLILPLVAALALARSARTHGGRVAWRRIVPWFIVWFVAAAALNGAGAIPAGWHAAIAGTAGFLIATALAGIGLQTDARAFARTGLRPLVLGLILWIAIASSALAIEHVFPG